METTNTNHLLLFFWHPITDQLWQPFLNFAGIKWSMSRNIHKFFGVIGIDKVGQSKK